MDFKDQDYSLVNRPNFQRILLRAEEITGKLQIWTNLFPKTLEDGGKLAEPFAFKHRQKKHHTIATLSKSGLHVFWEMKNGLKIGLASFSLVFLRFILIPDFATVNALDVPDPNL